jgi:CSLREA domain-containing protein
VSVSAVKESMRRSGRVAWCLAATVRTRLRARARSRGHRRIAVGFLFVGLLPALALPASSGAAATTYTVNSTADTSDANIGDGICDDGTGARSCTLRAAIEESNKSVGAKDMIALALPSSPFVIAVASSLPPITDPVTIDATTQPGYVASPIVELRGSLGTGLEIDATDSAVRGLAIDGFSFAAIWLHGGGGSRIEGNYLGLDTSGLTGLGHALSGILIESSNNTIGGTTETKRNVISGGTDGIMIASNSGDPRDASGNAILGNFIGTDATGKAEIPNTGIGIEVHAPDTTIGGSEGTTPGGSCTGACNLVSGNGGDGIAVYAGTVYAGSVPSAAVIQGNFVGVDSSGTSALPNGDVAGVYITEQSPTVLGGVEPAARNIVSGNDGYGIVLSGSGNTIEGNFVGSDTTGQLGIGNAAGGINVGGNNNRIGGTGAGQRNLIAFNGTPASLGAGVFVGAGPFACCNNRILRNSIFDNAGLGIDLAPGGPNPNDLGDSSTEPDSDEGPNHLQNFPVLDSAVSDGTAITIAGTLISTPNRADFRLEFFANDACDSPAPVGSFGEGKTFLGFKTVMTDGSGAAPFTATFQLANPLPSNAVIAATATDADGNTSEFSECRNVAPGAPVGTIVVVKRTKPSGDPATFTFTGTAAGTIGDGGEIRVADLEPGTYKSTETVPSGWDVDSITCNDADSTGDTATATFRLDPGETVTCTFTNAKRAHLKIDKVTQPSGDPQSFGFTSALGNFSLSDAATPKDFTVAPGTYSVSESATQGWDLTDLSCSDNSNQSGSTATVTLSAGQTVTCTFTNAKRGLARVLKTVSGSPITGLLPPNQQSFTFQLRTGASATNAGTLLEQQDASVANGGVVTFATKLVANSPYQLCEIVMPGWQTTLSIPFVLYNPSGDNSTLCTTFSVAPGETKSIAVDNRPPPGGLAHTIGFWKNWASCASSNGKQKPVLDPTLAAAGPEGITVGILTLHSGDCLKAVRLLNKSTIDTGKKMSSDPAFNLTAQLLAAELNVKAGALTCSSAISAINDAQTLLAAVRFNGITHDKLSAAQTSRANSLATWLDRYNNNLLC